MIAIELPVAFKVGYAKVQATFAAVVLAVGFLPALLLKLFGGRLLHGESPLQFVQAHMSQLDNPFIPVAFIVVALVILLISYGISNRFYQQRDI